MVKTKKENLFNHARQRAFERYGIDYTPNTKVQILRMITQNETILIRKQSARVSVRSATLNGISVRFVYDNVRKEVITFLPGNKQ